MRMKEKTLTRIRKFTEDRHWEKFHSPANLAKSISIEACDPVCERERQQRRCKGRNLYLLKVSKILRTYM